MYSPDLHLLGPLACAAMLDMPIHNRWAFIPYAQNFFHRKPSFAAALPGPLATAVPLPALPAPAAKPVPAAPPASRMNLLLLGSSQRAADLYDLLAAPSGSRWPLASGFRKLRAFLDPRQLWSMPVQDPLHAVILDFSLRTRELDDACRHIRRNWPAARILLVRHCEPALDDALYDDRIAPEAPPEIMLTALERLLKRWRP